MRKTILITGGAGFIGSHLIDRMIDENNIICVDNFNNFYAPQIKEDNIKKHLLNNKFRIYRTDIRDYGNLSKIFDENEIDIVVHLAACAGIRPSLEQPILYTEMNINGTLNLLELVKKNNIKKLIFASSSSVYGSQQITPFKEEMNVNSPISPYAATKIACEQLCHVYSHLYSIQINCLRLFTVYGPRQRPDLAIHKFARCIIENRPITLFGDGTTKRDYTYIDDVIKGILAAINYERAPFEIFNIGESQTVELRYLVELLEKNIGKKATIERKPVQDGDMMVTYADITKARDLLGYKPCIKIEDGISLFMNWFKAGAIN